MIDALIAKAVGYVWYYPVVGLCIGLGVFYTIRLALIQLRCFPHAIALISGRYDNPNETGQITHFQALAAALSGTIGLGNIAGVAIAIAMGGPGAILWMWIVGVLGMATKYAECFLGTLYRDVNPSTGEVRGGPMFYIEKGLGKKWKPVAVIYGVCMVLGCFGAGNMFQSNQAASVLKTFYNVPPFATGIILAILVGIVIVGGIKRIGKVASRVVPFMCIGYLIGAWLICILNLDKVPAALMLIVSDAFTGQAAAGGVIGSVVIWGVRRGVFSNEAGLGSASIAHAAVKTDYPIREGIVASLGPLIDTIIVCSATAIVIVMSGNYGTGRYQPVMNPPISFESTKESYGLNWALSTSPNKESELLRSYRHDNASLYYSGSGSHQSGPIGLMLDDDARLKKPSAIRFSSFGNGRRRSVLISNSQGIRLATLPIGSQELSITSSDGRPLATISASMADDQWESIVIDLSGALQRTLATSGLLIEFQSDDEVPWYIDKIECVKPYSDVGLTVASFDKFLTGFGSIFLVVSVLFFAYSTLITWSYYGEVAIQYVFGKKAVLPFKWVFVGLVCLGANVKLSTVLNFSDLALGLMVIPNAIAIMMLSGIVASHTNNYFSELKLGRIKRFK